MKKLTESDVVTVFREEWARRRARLAEEAEEIDITAKTKVPGDGIVSAISPGLKVKHKESGLRYTVVSIDLENGDVVLRKPDGEVAPVEPIAGGNLNEDDVVHKFPEDGSDDYGEGTIKIDVNKLESEYVLA